ncbi:MAG TPA: TusE/DsrC/DsvC family sulfur relay protein [Burkholderiales bacterium]|nr:TusE/DsrC/DsvC family sulfur relay protein [Burkholderiales bacterium]
MYDANKAISMTEEAMKMDPEGNLYELPEWSEKIAEKLAEKEGISLTDEHWEVIRLLRHHYSLHGRDLSGPRLLRALEEPFGMRGGIKHLYELFPGGPVNQGSRIAGIPAPAYSSDKSFGSVV